MNIVSVDIGSYSVKMLTFKIEKGLIHYQWAREVVIDSDEYNIMANHIEWDLQLKIVNEYLSHIQGEYKLIINAPCEILTTRFLNLPVKNKKKALMMIPFQLEEDIPYSLNEAHYASAFTAKQKDSEALVSIARKKEFGDFFDKLTEYKIEPKILTSKESVCHNYFKNTNKIYPPSFCLLDIGHTTAKAYFFIDNQLVSTQKSFIAGKTLSEVIATNYKIDLEEANLYKHQNCFFLTQDQYENVNENQRTFAKLMHNAMIPFIQDFQRWEIGHKVKHGIGISEILLTGGTSNIKNINNFLTYHLGVKVSYFHGFDDLVNDQKIDSDEKFRRKFSIANMLSFAYKFKGQNINLLSGDFSIKGEANLPLHSMVFISSRVAMVMILFIISFMFERFFLKKEIDQVNRSLQSLAKNPILNLTPRQQRLIAVQPELIKNDFSKKKNSITQEVKLMQSSANINAISGLKLISKLISSFDCEIITFSSISNTDYNAIIKAQDLKILKEIEDILSEAKLQNLFIEVNETDLTLNLSAEDKL